MKKLKLITLLLIINFSLALSGVEGLINNAHAQKKNKDKKTTELSDEERRRVDAIFFEAQKERLIGNLDKAKELFLRVAEKDPQNATAFYEIARIYIKQKDNAEAINYAQKAYEIKNNNEWIGGFYADLLKKQQRVKEADKVFENLTNLFPKNKKFYSEWAELNLNNSNYKSAIEIIEKQESNLGITKAGAEIKKAAYFKLNKPEKAIETIEQLVESDPSNNDLKIYLGRLYEEIKEYDKALNLYEKLQKQDPSNEKIALLLSDLYRMKGEHKKAFESLNVAFASHNLDIDPKIQVIVQYLPLIQVDPELKMQVYQLTETILKTHPDNPKSFTVRGDLLSQDGKYKDARINYRKAIDFDLGSQKYSIWEQILKIDLQIRDFQNLLKDSEEALELFPSQPLIYFLNGLAKIQEKKYDEAIGILNSGLIYVYEDDELKGNFYSSLGDAYQAEEQFEKSNKAYDNALKIDPKNATVLNNYAYYLSLRKSNLDKALEMSEKANDLEPNNASYLDTQAWILFQKENYTEAKNIINKALENGGSKNPTVLEHQGDILFKLNKIAEAVQVWQKAKEAGSQSKLLDKKIAESKFIE